MMAPKRVRKSDQSIKENCKRPKTVKEKGPRQNESTTETDENAERSISFEKSIENNDSSSNSFEDAQTNVQSSTSTVDEDHTVVEPSTSSVVDVMANAKTKGTDKNNIDCPIENTSNTLRTNGSCDNIKTKQKYNNYEYKSLHSYKMYDEVKNFAKLNSLSKVTTSKTKIANIEYFRCNILSKGSFKECPVRMKVEMRHTDQLYRIFCTTLDHEHGRHKTRISNEMELDIINQYESGSKPKTIHKYMLSKHGDSFAYNEEHIRYTIKKHKMENIAPIDDIGDLNSWFKSQRKVPTSLDEPFVVAYATNPKSGAFNAVFSTKRLLSFAETDVLCSDSTYKLVWNDFPIIIVGTFDAHDRLHILGFSVSTNETSADYAFLFSSVKEAAKKIHEIEMKPRYIVSDAAGQIRNGFSQTFNIDAKGAHIMCWFHMKKAIDTQKFEHKSSKDLIKADIDILHFSPDESTFEYACNKFVTKWEIKEKHFIKYLKVNGF